MWLVKTLRFTEQWSSSILGAGMKLVPCACCVVLQWVLRSAAQQSGDFQVGGMLERTCAAWAPACQSCGSIALHSRASWLVACLFIEADGRPWSQAHAERTIERVCHGWSRTRSAAEGVMRTRRTHRHAMLLKLSHGQITASLHRPSHLIDAPRPRAPGPARGCRELHLRGAGLRVS
eukprot:1251894-Prymnesium_polylepis.1